MLAVRPLTCENENGPRGAGNTTGGLTHSLDYTEEGLAMKATPKTCDAPDCDRPARSPGSAWCDLHYRRMRTHGTLDRPTHDNRGKTCAADDCTTPAKTKGYCGKHWERIRAHGAPNVVHVIRDDAERRFWTHVDKTDTCWLWTLPLTYDGYGIFRVGSVRTGAHRWAWKFTHGDFPAEGLQLDHLCRVRHCVNPEHLEPVTPLVNTRRAIEARR